MSHADWLETCKQSKVCGSENSSQTGPFWKADFETIMPRRLSTRKGPAGMISWYAPLTKEKERT